MAVDVKGQRLFVAALGNNTLEVVDLKNGMRSQSVAGLREPQGVRYLPQSNTIVVANGGDGAVMFLDGTSLKTQRILRLGVDADNVRYDEVHGRVYVGYGNGALSVLDEKGGRVGDIPLNGHPESFQVESAAGRMYVNVPSRREIAVVDSKALKVTARWTVTEAANYPMALDEAHHRLFVVTRRPPRLLVYGTGTGKLIASLEADGDCDDVFYDARRNGVYASFGDGTLVVYRQLDGDHYALAARIPTRAGARTAFFSPELAQFYVAAPHRLNEPAEIRVYEVQR